MTQARGIFILRFPPEVRRNSVVQHDWREKATDTSSLPAVNSRMEHRSLVDGVASHYEVLNLSLPPVRLKKEDLKSAYHQALLRHHPDKSSSSPSSPPSQSSSSESPCRSVSRNSSRSFTVDQITTAYKTLSDPAEKSEYDRKLVLSGFAEPRSGKRGAENDVVFRTGLEILDLDDMKMEEGDGDRSDTDVWYRECRCGDEKGFLVHEEDLERESEKGEIMIGCRGCSLWAKVVFAVEE